MAQASKIEWTESTWNPVTGCTKISEGCAHCYAERMARRLHAMGNPRYKNNFKVTLHHDLIEAPLKWNKPRLIFVNSMSDLFHKDIPLSFIKKIFTTMQEAHWHTFQVVTKRSERLAELAPKLPWPDNVWMGVTVESERYTSRFDDLASVPATVRFSSMEPLLSPITKFSAKQLDWVIVGGESGPGSRAMQEQWVRAIHARCRAEQIPFFFKQWGGVRKKQAGRLLDNQTWDEMPCKVHARPSLAAV